MRRGRFWLSPMLLFLGGLHASAAGPRWVTGPPYFATNGLPVVWYTDSPFYYTDPGDLSAWVDHAAADAMVAAAAAVWNVPTSRLVLTQGGSLNEHVSQSNTYPIATGVVFPADVQTTNGAAKQIAVIYDRDGSVTDLLLGVGASDPSGCRQSGVTESVDSITPDGFIRHAVLVLNGRCTGPAPEMQLQMQYQLMRAFGRVLGLGWSQTNDNVFTGTPTPTFQQAMHWPVMHPIDILCAQYTYQCMPQPFTLRDDDVAALALLYFIPQGQAGVGKTDTLLNANRIGGRIQFPTGQGMQGVNVVERRFQQYRPDTEIEPWETVSSVSGALFRQTSWNAVTGEDDSMLGSMGTANAYFEGRYDFARVPMLPGDWQWAIVQTQPVNPLYVGAYAVGPYVANTVQPSGSATTYKAGIFGSYSVAGGVDLTVTGSAANCSGPSGTESAPQAVYSGGWWSGQLCGYGQVSWSNLVVKANRSLTVEVTAQDEQGFASTGKALPVIGVWNGYSALGSPPDWAATNALNGVSAGMTSLQVSGMLAGGLRMAIADQRGDGRPDFNFGARVLYADSITPANVGAGGGVVTISGMGFRPGNVVSVRGVRATVQSWSPTTIVATVPASRTLAGGSPGALTVDVAVQDLLTGGVTVMSGVLSYAAPQAEQIQVVSAPGATTVGTVAGSAFTVRVTEADGATPVAGEIITFSAIGGSGTALFGACGAATCTVVTNAAGAASTVVMPTGVGTILLTATGTSSQSSVSFTGLAPVRTVTPRRAVEYVAAGATVAWSPQVVLADNSASVAGVGVVWTGARGLAVGSGMSGLGTSGSGTSGSGTSGSGTSGSGTSGSGTSGPEFSSADGSGMASISAMIGPLEAEEQATGTACAWTGASSSTSSGTSGGTSPGAVCSGFAAQGVAAQALQVEVVTGAGQMVPSGGTLSPVVVRVTDGAGHAVAGVNVMVRQTVQAGATCPAQGRCPTQPVLSQGQTVAVSDVDGLVSVVPMQVAGVEVTNLVVTAGTLGFVSLALSKG